MALLKTHILPVVTVVVYLALKNTNKAKLSGDIFNSCVLTRLFEYAQRFYHNPAGAHTFTANDGSYLFNSITMFNPQRRLQNVLLSVLNLQSPES